MRLHAVVAMDGELVGREVVLDGDDGGWLRVIRVGSGKADEGSHGYGYGGHHKSHTGSYGDNYSVEWWKIVDRSILR